MASPTGGNDAGSFGREISFELQSKDLPSRRLLGKGLSGIGYETTWKGERFARKDFVGAQRDIFVQEAAVLVGLKDHPNIVKTYGWTVDKRSCSLVLEYMDDDLLSLLQKRTESTQGLAGKGLLGEQSSSSTCTQHLDLPEAVDMMLQIATGIEYLHEQGIAHGDLKTRNILVSHRKDGNPNSKSVKVADFGLVRTKKTSKFIVSRQARKLDMVQWKAPEDLKILTRQLNLSSNEDGTSSESESESTQSLVAEVSSNPPVGNVRVSKADAAFAADVYSFAVTCSQILTGNGPDPALDWKELVARKLSGLRPNLPDACHPLLRNLLTRVLQVDPTERPSFSTIRKDLHRLLTTGSLETGNAMVPVATFLTRPFKSWRHSADLAPILPKRKESKNQWLLRRCFEIMRQIPKLRQDLQQGIQPHGAVEKNISSPGPRLMLSSSNSFLPDIGIELDPYDKAGPARVHTSHDEAAMAISERCRRDSRVKQQENFAALKQLVPIISKNDKASILGDAVIYLKDLQRQIEELEARRNQMESQCENLKLSYQDLEQRNKELEESWKQMESRHEDLKLSHQDLEQRNKQLEAMAGNSGELSHM